MITVLPSAPFYNIFFNGLLKYQVMGEEHYCKLEECRYHISGTSVPRIRVSDAGLSENKSVLNNCDLEHVVLYKNFHQLAGNGLVNLNGLTGYTLALALL